MASEEQVKKYLAYWFQLGKKVVINNGEEQFLPQPIFQGDRYSKEFEVFWQQVISKSGSSYLEGTNETIAELLTSKWDMILCCRCDMPIPARTMGMPAENCPCIDLPSWPNTEIPKPRSPVSSQTHLNSITSRLRISDRHRETENESNVPERDSTHLVLDFPLCPCAKKSQCG